MSPSQTRYRWTELVAMTTALSHIVALVSADCFLPNSTDRNSIWDGHGGDYQPTGFGSSVDNFQMCCATNGRAVPDIPRKDGLCQNGAAIWRESCTDPTWKSPSCIKLCIDGGNGVWIENGQPTTINLNATQVTTVFTASASETTPAGLPAPPPPQSAGLAGGAIAGIAVGAIAGTMIPALAIWLCILRPRKRRRDNMDAKNAPDMAPQPVDTHGPPAEMNAPESRYLWPALDNFKGDPSMYPYTQVKDGTLRWEVSGHSDRDVLRVELAGEDPMLQTKKQDTELVGSMPAYRELE
ncbi:MAG: hypothetical protein Q9207_007440 [Kuettlingeria erythrocarpa]